MKCLESQSVRQTKGRGRRRFAAVLLMGVGSAVLALFHPLPVAKAQASEQPASPKSRPVSAVDSKAIRKARGWLRESS